MNYILTYIPVSVAWQCVIYLILVALVLTSIIVVDKMFGAHFIHSQDVQKDNLIKPLRDTPEFDLPQEDKLMNIRKRVYQVVNSNEKPDTWADRWTVWKKFIQLQLLFGGAM